MKKFNLKGAAKSKELGRRLKYGSLSIVLTVMVVVAVVLTNVVASMIVDRFPALSIDTTENEYYELSDQSIDYIKTLGDYDIKITFIGSKQTLAKDTYYNKVTTLVERYHMYAPNIKIDYVDLDKNPGFGANYDDAALVNGNAIVEYKDRYRILTSTDFIYMKESESNSESSTEETKYDYSLTAEYAVTTALMVVTASDEPHATVITGHGEKELPKLVKMLERNGFVVNTQSIIKEFDKDCSLLIIASPTKDYSYEDTQKLDDFMYNNGKYNKNIFYIADYSQPKLPNLEAFLYDWGIVLEEGVVYESDTSVANANNPALNKLTFYDPELTQQSSDAEVTAYGYYGRPATQANRLDTSMAFNIILQHSETSKVGTIFDGKLVRGENDPVAYVAMSKTTLVKTINNQLSESHLLFANSTGFFEDDLFESSYSANPDVTIEAINDVLGRENKVNIKSKNLIASSLLITLDEATTIGVVTTIVIPVILLIVCLVVYIRRRFV